MTVKKDIEIAQETRMLPIGEIAAKLSIDDAYVESYGGSIRQRSAAICSGRRTGRTES